MWDKRRYATHIVSNLTFDPAVIRGWVRRLRARGVTMPLLLGIPGPVDRTKLLAMATKIGVGESTRFLAKHKGTFARLAAPGGFTGERFLEQCAPALGRARRPRRRAARVHVQPDRRDRGVANRPAGPAAEASPRPGLERYVRENALVRLTSPVRNLNLPAAIAGGCSWSRC